MHDLTKAEPIDYQGQEVSVAASLRETVLSAFASLNSIAEAGDDHTLRVPHIHKTRAHLERLAKLLNLPKSFDQCTAADIVASLAEVDGDLPAEETSRARKAVGRAIRWVEAAGKALDYRDNVCEWTPGGPDAAA